MCESVLIYFRQKSRQEEGKQETILFCYLYINNHIELFVCFFKFNRILTFQILHWTPMNRYCRGHFDDYYHLMIVELYFDWKSLDSSYFLRLMAHDMSDMFHAKNKTQSLRWSWSFSILRVEANVWCIPHENDENKEVVLHHRFLWNHPYR